MNHVNVMIAPSIHPSSSVEASLVTMYVSRTSTACLALRFCQVGRHHCEAVGFRVPLSFQTMYMVHDAGRYQ